MIDKDLSVDRTRTSWLRPEDKQDIDTGALLTPEVKALIETGDLLAAKEKINVATGGLLSAEQISDIITGGLLTAESKNDLVTGGLLAAKEKINVATGGLLSAEQISDIITGGLLTAESKNDLVTGGLLAANSLPVSEGFPLNYARIGYDNILFGGASSATSDNTGSLNLLSPATYDRWRPSSGTNTVTLLSNQTSICNYVGIAAHNLSGKTVVVNVSSGGAQTEVFNGVVSSNNSMFIRFTDLSCDRVIIQVTGVDVEIGVVYLGKELEMMRPNVYSGHKPVTLNANDKMTPQMSDSGQFLGKQIVRKGYSTQAGFKHLKNDWYMDNFQPFVEHAKTLPYFWAWNLAEHPEQIVYGWTSENISPSLMGIRDWFEVEFNIMAHA